MPRLGYSFWGFLGNGILDTPDGGRSHRLRLLGGLRAAGYELVLLQRNRDALEANDPSYLTLGEWESDLFPDIDSLMLEWRWPVPGRNVGPVASGDQFTPDLE